MRLSGEDIPLAFPIRFVAVAEAAGFDKEVFSFGIERDSHFERLVFVEVHEGVG